MKAPPESTKHSYRRQDPDVARADRRRPAALVERVQWSHQVTHRPTRSRRDGVDALAGIEEPQPSTFLGPKAVVKERQR
jgi:hypothetical protein